MYEAGKPHGSTCDETAVLLLVAPVMEEKVTQRSVYLPAGATWTDANTGEVYEGGQRVIVPAPLDIIPVFFRDGKKYDIYQ